MHIDCVACCFVIMLTAYSLAAGYCFDFIVMTGWYVFSCFDCAWLLLIVVVRGYWCFGFG